MSTQRDELAMELFIADNSGESREAALMDWEALDLSIHAGKTYAHNIADALIAAGWTKPRTITTVEELDALPVGSVVLTATGHPAHPFVASQKYDNNGDPIWHRGGRLGGSHGDYVIPATVLYEPTA